MKKVNPVLTVKIGYITVSAFTVLLGIFLIIRPQTSLNIICRISGAVIAVCGAVKLAGYFSKDLYRLAFEHDLIFGTLLCVIGIAALVRPVKVISSMHIVAGIIILEEGIFKLRTAVDAKRFGLNKWHIITVLAVLTITAGILLLLNPFEAAQTMTVILGAAMIADGILNLCVAVYAIKVTKNRFIEADYHIEERNDENEIL